MHGGDRRCIQAKILKAPGNLACPPGRMRIAYIQDSSFDCRSTAKGAAQRPSGPVFKRLSRPVTPEPEMPRLTADPKPLAQGRDIRPLQSRQQTEFLTLIQDRCFPPNHPNLQDYDASKVSGMSPNTCQLCTKTEQLRRAMTPGEWQG